MKDRETSLEPYHETTSNKQEKGESESNNCVFFHVKLL